MNLRIVFTCFALFVFHVGFARGFKAEKLVGNWDVKFGKVLLSYEFTDTWRVSVYVKTDDSPLIYTLQNITASGFTMSLHLDGGTDKTHAAATKCTWIRDNHFTAVPA